MANLDNRRIIASEFEKGCDAQMPIEDSVIFINENRDAVAKFANDTEYGLSSSVWTQNLKAAHMMARKIRAGTVCINTHNYGDPAWPFGGYKQSGWGREMGKEVMELYTETKAVAAKL